jgi:hypothetical protein
MQPRMGADNGQNSGATASLILARLRTLEEEIRHLTDLAAKEDDEMRRSQYWDMARDVQAEARKAREVLAKMEPIRGQTRSQSTLGRALKGLGLRMDAAALHT